MGDKFIDWIWEIESSSDEEYHAPSGDIAHTRLKLGIRIAYQKKAERLLAPSAGYPQAIPEVMRLIRRGGMYILEGVFVDMGEIFFNPHLIVSKALRLIGLSNHPFTAYGPSLDLMLRYQDQMPLDRFVTHRFSLE